METGLYYYGARFYDPRFSFWYGVDPLAEKFPGFSPYNYCLNNPVMLVDPDGRSPRPPGWYVNYQGFYIYTSTGIIRGNFGLSEYLGESLPSTFNNSYFELISIDGVLYHKNTNNWTTGVVNNIFGTSYVEKKEYDRAWESFSQELQLGALGLGAGSILAKFAGPAIGRIISQFKTNPQITNYTNFFNSALQTSKNGMTSVGRALQKHAGREGSSFSGITFSGKTATEDGMNILKEILNSPSQLIDRMKNGTKTIYDKTTGRGVNVGRDGKFNGFRDILERNLNDVMKK